MEAFISKEFLCTVLVERHDDFSAWNISLPIRKSIYGLLLLHEKNSGKKVIIRSFIYSFFFH